MLSTPKKTSGKPESKPTSETASFKKVAYGFSPDEVNLYISTLRKRNLELQNEMDKLTESIDPEKVLRLETIERRLVEADQRYTREKELTVMLERECTRLGEDIDKLSQQLAEAMSGGGSAGAEAEALRAQLDKSKVETESLKMQLEQAKSEVDSSKAQFAEAVSTTESVQAKYDSRKIEINELRAQLEETRGEVETLTAQSKQGKSSNDAELESIKRKFEQSKSDNDILIQQLEHMQEDIENLNKRLKEAKAAPPVPAAVATPASPAAAQASPAVAPVEKAKHGARYNDELPPKKAAPPVIEDDMDMDFADFQLPKRPNAPIFEEAVAEEEVMDEEPLAKAKKKAAKGEDASSLEDKLSTVLAEIGDLKSQLAKSKNVKPEEEDDDLIPEKKKGKGKNERLSRAELKIQILQEEAEESYIIPDKYLKMIEDMEDQEDEDDFSYLLSEVSFDDAAGGDDDLDIMVSAPLPVPSLSKAPPPPRRQAHGHAPPPMPEQEQYTRSAGSPQVEPGASPIRMAPRPAQQGAIRPNVKTRQEVSVSPGKSLINADDAEEDPRFAEKLNRDFNKPEPKGRNIEAKNPLQRERGEDIKPRNPLQKEKGPDLDENLYEMVVGEAANPNRNVQAFSDDDDYGMNENEII